MGHWILEKLREKLAHRRIKLAVISKYRRPWAERPRKGLFKHILCFGRACSWCQPLREGAEGLGSSPQPSPKCERVPSLWLYRFTAASAEVSVVNKDTSLFCNRFFLSFLLFFFLNLWFAPDVSGWATHWGALVLGWGLVLRPTASALSHQFSSHFLSQLHLLQ